MTAADLPVTLISQGSNVLIRVVDPEDDSEALGDPQRLMTVANGAAATARLYEPRLDTKLRSDVAIGIAIIGVQNARLWKIGMSAELELDDDFAVARHEASVTDVDEAAGTITISPALAITAASRGKRVRRILRATSGGLFFLNLSQYGTPAENDETWGFHGSATASYELVGTLGAEILSESKITGSSVGTVQERFRIVDQNR